MSIIYLEALKIYFKTELLCADTTIIKSKIWYYIITKINYMVSK